MFRVVRTNGLGSVAPHRDSRERETMAMRNPAYRQTTKVLETGQRRRGPSFRRAYGEWVMGGRIRACGGSPHRERPVVVGRVSARGARYHCKERLVAVDGAFDRIVEALLRAHIAPIHWGDVTVHHAFLSDNGRHKDSAGTLE